MTWANLPLEVAAMFAELAATHWDEQCAIMRRRKIGDKRAQRQAHERKVKANAEASSRRREYQAAYQLKYRVEHADRVRMQKRLSAQRRRADPAYRERERQRERDRRAAK